jgi:lantibiotic modifying enzyme
MSPTRRDVLLGALGAAAFATLPRELWSSPESPLSARPNLDVALRAERWIRKSRVPTEHGVLWPADPTNEKSVQRGFYNGFPGVVLFLLELYHATGDKQHLEEAARGAAELAAGLPADASAVRDAGLYTGLAGLGFIFEETFRATKDVKFRNAAKRATELIQQSAKPTGRGVEWSASNDIISGSAGIGLYLLRAANTYDDKSLIALAAQAGKRLIEVGQPEHGGLKWQISPTVTNLYPNFSHGAAGVGYFLATLHQATGDRAFLDGALAAVRYLDAVARKDGDGWMVFHHEPTGKDLFYLSWCHGPAGTARLFYRLNQITKEKQWLEYVHRCARATIGTGIPEQRTPGFWNNISQCCGNCGVGEFFVSLQRIAPNDQYLSMVRRAAADTLTRATPEDDGLKWTQAEHRVQPQLLIAQTGFMQGAAGVGTYFLHVDALEKRRKPIIVFPDSPF